MSTAPAMSGEPVVVVGGGLSGLATALGCAVRDRPVVVIEAADMVGGAAAYSGGMVWVGVNHVAANEGVEDSLELAEQYVRDAAVEAPGLLDEHAMRRWLRVAPVAAKYWEDVGAIRWEVIPGLADYHRESAAALPEGRYLTGAPFDGRELGEWRDKLRVSPFFPVGMTYAEMFVNGRRRSHAETTCDGAALARVHALGRARPDDGPNLPGGDRLTFGTGIVASFLHRVLAEDAVDIRLSHRVVALMTDGGRVVGARAEGPHGVVEVRGPVVIATSGFDGDPELVRELIGLGPDDFGSVAPPTVRGDGLRLARSVGAATVVVPTTSNVLLPGWQSRDGLGFEYGAESSMPHSMIVDSIGKRYCDDSYWVQIVRKTLDPAGRHLPFYLIWDEQHRQKYGLGGTPPGGDYPEGMVTSAATIGELGTLLGIDATQLVETARRFSEHAARGEDPDFGRGTVEYIRRFTGDPKNLPNPLLGPIVQAPFYGMRLRFVGAANGSTGVLVDSENHVLDDAGEVIPGLYAAGACTALTATGGGYNSGYSLGRGLTGAYLISSELGG